MRIELVLKMACTFTLLLLLQSCTKPDIKETTEKPAPAPTPSIERPVATSETKVAKDIVYAKSQAELDKATAQGNIVVDIHGEAWCAPCKQMAPVIKALSDEMPDVTFIKVNVDDFKPKAGFHGVPTFIFYKDSREIYRTAGSSPKATFKKMVEQKFGL